MVEIVSSVGLVALIAFALVKAYTNKILTDLRTRRGRLIPQEKLLTGWRTRCSSTDTDFRSAEWEVAGPNVFDDGPKSYLENDRGGRLGFIPWNFSGLRSAVRLDGTLNDSTDVDQGWTVEIALPWSGFGIVGEGRSVPAEDGDTCRIDASRFQRMPPERAHRGGTAGWAWNRHGPWDSHMPHVFPHIDLDLHEVPAAPP